MEHQGHSFKEASFQPKLRLLIDALILSAGYPGKTIY